MGLAAMGKMMHVGEERQGQAEAQTSGPEMDGTSGTGPLLLVAPDRPDWAVEAVRRGGGRVLPRDVDGNGVGSPDGVIWVTGSPAGLLELIGQYPSLRWAQLPMAGVEGLAEAGLFADPRASHLTWTCAKGSFGQPVAEHALALALAGLRQLKVRAEARSWGPQMGLSLYDAPVTVLGAGGITLELLALLKPFRCQVTVVRRSAVPVPGAHRTVTTAHLDDVLPSALVVFVAPALVPSTVNIISARELSLMRPDAWLVNVGRGRHVDTAALVDALTRRAIGGAALDVTEPEPLPDGHPLWSLDNCLITPHTANTRHMSQPLLAERIEDNVRRLAGGRPLVGTVDTVAGY